MDAFTSLFLKELTTTWAGLNLTRVLSPEAFYQKQVLDSLLPAQQSVEFLKRINESSLVVDLGFGCGVPLLPLAKTFQNIHFSGVEARGKKVNAVQCIAQSLRLGNVSTLHKRFEDVLFNRNCVIISKAMAKTVDILRNLKICDRSISVFLYKGPNYWEIEGDSLKSGWMKKNWREIENFQYQLDGTDGRIFVGYEFCGEIVDHAKRWHMQGKGDRLLNLYDTYPLE